MLDPQGNPLLMAGIPAGTFPLTGRSRLHRSVPMDFQINGRPVTVDVDLRTSLLDLLRDHLGLTGSKKGCNQGACGACTVLVDGERINACLALAVQCQGREITTVEGLADGDRLHRLQAAFVAHDGFQCGYCTPGQLCSAIAMAAELARGVPSHVTDDLAASDIALSRDELRERMSGNLCRCGAHNGIVAAIAETFGEDVRNAHAPREKAA
jgi:xanthine dehydrogenase YagT iron-sulfur-binding subunit